MDSHLYRNLKRCEEVADYEWWPWYAFDVVIACVVFNGLAFLLGFYTIATMVRHKETRTNSFNIYVISLLLPDALYNLQMFFLGIGEASCGRNADNFLFRFMLDTGIALIYGFFFTNFFLNCILAYELLSLLKRSHRGVRTGAPPVPQTLVRVALVYALAIVLVVLLQYTGGNQAFALVQMVVGLACLVFVVAVRLYIWKQGWIPRRGRTRVIALFFERIVLVFLVFYFPAAVLMFVFFSLGYLTFWTHQLFFVLAALQALVTLGVVLQKPDIARAFVCGRDGRCSEALGCGGYDARRSSAVETVEDGGGVVEGDGNRRSKWVMDDVYDTQSSSADRNAEDGDAVENDGGDAMEDDVEANATDPSRPTAAPVTRVRGAGDIVVEEVD